jgi:hypothetical protein
MVETLQASWKSPLKRSCTLRSFGRNYLADGTCSRSENSYPRGDTSSVAKSPRRCTSSSDPMHQTRFSLRSVQPGPPPAGDPRRAGGAPLLPQVRCAVVMNTHAHSHVNMHIAAHPSIAAAQASSRAAAAKGRRPVVPLPLHAPCPPPPHPQRGPASGHDRLHAALRHLRAGRGRRAARALRSVGAGPRGPGPPSRGMAAHAGSVPAGGRRHGLHRQQGAWWWGT